MILKELEPDQIETLYKQRMIIDFPKDELKPLKMILEARGRGIYECLGVFEDDELIGYSFFEKAEGNYLLDYLAVFPEKRNGGIGSRVLGLLEEHFAEADLVIGEVEDPERAENDADRQLQARRLGFYLRNGCRDTGLRVECFGVPFVIFASGKGECPDPDSIWEIYRRLYGQVLSDEVVERKLKRL